MSRTPRRAAAWASTFSPTESDQKPIRRTHKLAALRCLLWLPDYGAYVREVNLAAGTFTVSPAPENAMCLGEDLAESVGQDLVAVTGVRVHLRPFHPMH